MSSQLFTEGLELLAETLEGGKARRLRSAGLISARVGGPRRLVALFQAVSDDPQYAAEFREPRGRDAGAGPRRGAPGDRHPEKWLPRP
nr:hypothetical protein [Kibdelosporangium sp. MJ126-NF4]CTQ95714.1 hypothetical protein [Kibdelosporangium sp. MJ126-NF4]